MMEIGRVTRSGGVLILTTPNLLWSQFTRLQRFPGCTILEGPQISRIGATETAGRSRRISNSAVGDDRVGAWRAAVSSGLGVARKTDPADPDATTRLRRVILATRR
jgi:hypothetical protein